MSAAELKDFRIVGGTALSLRLGHRVSVDIDLFSDLPYGTINFEAIDNFLKSKFPYVEHFSNQNPAFGKSYDIGKNKNEAVKLDIFYTDKFIQEIQLTDDIRLASVEEIIAMKFILAIQA